MNAFGTSISVTTENDLSPICLHPAYYVKIPIEIQVTQYFNARKLRGTWLWGLSMKDIRFKFQSRSLSSTYRMLLSPVRLSQLAT